MLPLTGREAETFYDECPKVTDTAVDNGLHQSNEELKIGFIL